MEEEQPSQALGTTHEDVPDWWPYAAEFPHWHVWRGVCGVVYARRPRTSPPVWCAARMRRISEIRSAEPRARWPDGIFLFAPGRCVTTLRSTAAAAAAGIVFGLCVGLAKLSAPFSCFSASSGSGVRPVMASLPFGSIGGARFRSR